MENKQPISMYQLDCFTMELPLVCTLTFVFLFVSGGISGMCVAHTGMDVLFHDTFYVIGHFHVMLAGGAMIGSFGAFYFYFVSIFGVKYSKIYSYLFFRTALPNAQNTLPSHFHTTDTQSVNHESQLEIFHVTHARETSLQGKKHWEGHSMNSCVQQ